MASAAIVMFVFTVPPARAESHNDLYFRSSGFDQNSWDDVSGSWWWDRNGNNGNGYGGYIDIYHGVLSGNLWEFTSYIHRQLGTGAQGPITAYTWDADNRPLGSDCFLIIWKNFQGANQYVTHSPNHAIVAKCTNGTYWYSQKAVHPDGALWAVWVCRYNYLRPDEMSISLVDYDTGNSPPASSYYWFWD